MNKQMLEFKELGMVSIHDPKELYAHYLFIFFSENMKDFLR